VKYSATGYRNPQCSACFINSVDDSLDSILTLRRRRDAVQVGSGTGTNLSSIRGSMEQLSGGGQASGPLSFMRGFDAFAGVIKSGGKTRAGGEDGDPECGSPGHHGLHRLQGERKRRKAFSLIKAGYDGSGPDSEAYSSIFFQNANNSVRVSDEFMRSYENDGEFSTFTVRGTSRCRPTGRGRS